MFYSLFSFHLTPPDHPIPVSLHFSIIARHLLVIPLSFIIILLSPSFPSFASSHISILFFCHLSRLSNVRVLPFHPSVSISLPSHLTCLFLPLPSISMYLCSSVVFLSCLSLNFISFPISRHYHLSIFSRSH